MKKTLKLKTLALSLALAGAASVAMVPAAAQAGVSYNASVSNNYLWRGQDISNGQAVVSGGIDYASDTGLYAGVWASSEDGGTETDLYGGYGFTSGDFGLNLAYWSYWYPTDGNSSTFSRNSTSTYDPSLASEYEVTMSYADLSLTTMIDTENTDNKYYSLNYGIGAFGLHAGMFDGFDETGVVGNSDYTDFNVSYAATDNLSFTLSKAQGDGLLAEHEKPILNVAYSFKF